MGEKVINMNYAAVEAGGNNVVKIEVPADWKKIVLTNENENADRPAYITNIVDVINAQKGDDLPVSTFTGSEDWYF